MSLLLVLSAASAGTCAEYAAPERIFVHDVPVDESSGVAASRLRQGAWFTHGDSGGEPILHTFDLDGRYLGGHLVDGADFVDWEDLAPGPCPRDGSPCLYIGDIGDNDADRDAIKVYVVPEPGEGEPARAEDVRAGWFADRPRDAETLLVHPCTGDVFVVTKEDDAPAEVYRFPAGGSGPLERIAVVELGGEAVTGGQWSPEGDRVVLRTDTSVWQWDTSPTDAVGHWKETPRAVAHLDEEQGEAVAFGLDGSLLTSSEGTPLVLHQLACLDPEPAAGTCTYEPRGCRCASSGNQPLWLAPLLAAAGLLRRRTTRA